MKEALKEKESAWREMKEKYETTRLEEKAESKRIHLEAEERTSVAKESLKTLFAKCSCTFLTTSTSYFREKKDLEDKLNAQIGTLVQRNEEFETENRKLREHQYTLDKKVSSWFLVSCV